MRLTWIAPWETLEVLKRNCKQHLQWELGDCVSFFAAGATIKCNRSFVVCMFVIVLVVEKKIVQTISPHCGNRQNCESKYHQSIVSRKMSKRDELSRALHKYSMFSVWICSFTVYQHGKYK